MERLKQKEMMTNKETIDRWAEQIIPAVFKAEDYRRQSLSGKNGWKASGRTRWRITRAPVA